VLGRGKRGEERGGEDGGEAKPEMLLIEYCLV